MTVEWSAVRSRKWPFWREGVFWGHQFLINNTESSSNSEILLNWFKVKKWNKEKIMNFLTNSTYNFV
jgi:hypothetical protein